MTTFRFLHMAGMALWFGSAVAIALAAGAERRLGPARAQSLRRTTLRVTTPGMLMAWVGGLGMLMPNFASLYARAGWMHGKLTLLLVMAAITGVLSGRLRRASLATDPVDAAVFGKLAGILAVVGLLIVALAVFRPGG